MAVQEVSFSSEVKDEIALAEIEDIHHIKCRLSAIIKLSGSLLLRNGGWVVSIRTENKKIAKFIFANIRSIYNSQSRIIVKSKRRFSKTKDSTEIFIEISSNTKDILKDLQIYSEEEGFQKLPDRTFLKDVNARRHYLTGAFMAGGSVNSPKTSNYHLEMAVSDEKIADFLAKKMKNLDAYIHLDPRIIKRRNQYVVYIKKAEMIEDFLKVISANRSLLNFADYRNERDYYNSVNRTENCQIANEEKSLKVGLEQKRYIEIIDEKMGLDSLDDSLKELAKIRLIHPEYSLTELGDEYFDNTNVNITNKKFNFLPYKKLNFFHNDPKFNNPL